MTLQKIRQYLTLTCKTPMPKLLFLVKSSTKLFKQGNQRWQIPRPATCQCLATFTLLKSKIVIFFRDVIYLLAQVFILLIDTATQEVPIKYI